MIETNTTEIETDSMASKIMRAVQLRPGLRLAELTRTVGGSQHRIWAKTMYMATLGLVRIERNDRRETRVYPK
jgi:hypothetical protein